MAITKSRRFEIFKRDNFTCQYCGRQTPLVVLEVDHIVPRAEGGPDDPNNLISACFDCNRGKGATPLSIQKLKEDRLEEIKKQKEKNQQLEEYEAFLREQRAEEENIARGITDYWHQANKGETALNDSGISSVKRFLKSLTPDEIKEAIDLAVAKVSSANPEGRFKYFCAVCHNKSGAKHGDNSRSDYKTVVKYWSKQKGRGVYFKEYELRNLCGQFDKQIIIDAIRQAFRGLEHESSYWKEFCFVLSSMTGKTISP